MIEVEPARIAPRYFYDNATYSSYRNTAKSTIRASCVKLTVSVTGPARTLRKLEMAALQTRYKIDVDQETG
jgi:hypothetical protein